MLSESDIELAHPDAFDFAFGNLPPVKRSEFNRHLSRCPHCQKVIDEYSEIGQVIKLLPPHVEPAADLEERTVAAMVAALAGKQAEDERPADAGDQSATRVYQIPQRRPSPVPETQVHPRPQLQPPAETTARPMATRLPVWRRYPRRLAGVVAAAAAVIVAAIVVPTSLLGRSAAVATVVIPLHATTAAKVFGVADASARATARQVDQSWTFDLTVHGLKVLPGNDVYECWWKGPGSTKTHPQLVSGGTFVVGNSGATTVTMTTGIDPRQFRLMEITAEPPGSGAQIGTVILTGQPTV
jgi:Anti-sigma-K factor rskA, C-terminal